MEEGSGEREAKSRHKPRTSVRLAIAALSIILGAWALIRMLTVPQRHVREKTLAYRAWHRQNRRAFDQFRELARREGWRMYVWAKPWHWERGSIGVLDLGRFAYEPLYSSPPGSRIWATSSPRAGKVAFIESRGERVAQGYERSRFRLGVLEQDGTVTKFPLHVGDASGPVALGGRHVFFESGSGPYVFDIEARTLRRLPIERHFSLREITLVGDKFLVLAGGDGALILEAAKPFRRLSSVEGGVVVAGEHVVYGKRGVCFLHEPATGADDELTDGDLLCSLPGDEFLFQRARDGPLYKYKISTRSPELFCRPPGRRGGTRRRPDDKKLYRYEELVVSPEGRFVLMPSELPTWIVKVSRPYEYEAYDVKSGEKRGAFLNAYKAELFLEFLGWVQTHETEQRARMPRRIDRVTFGQVGSFAPPRRT